MADIVNVSDVFISYSRKNADFARKLDTAFKEQNMEVWIDWEDIPKGANWREEIRAGVEGASAFLFIISPDSVASVECRNEIERAIASHKRFVPVVYLELSKEDMEQLDPAVSAHNWIFAREEDDWDQALQTILQTIQTDLDYVRQHTSLTVRARQWEQNIRDRSLLLRGSELKNAEDWLALGQGNEPKPTQLQINFIEGSRRVESARQRRLLAGISVTVVIGALAILSFLFAQEASVQRDTAQSNAATAVAAQSTSIANETVALRQAVESSSRALAFGAREANANDQLKSIALVIQAVEVENPPVEAQRALADIAYSPGPNRHFIGYDGRVLYAALSPNNTKAVFLTQRGEISVLYLSGDKAGQRDQYIIEDYSLEFAVISPDDHTALIAAFDQRKEVDVLSVILFDLDTGTEQYRLDLEGNDISSAAFHPDATWMLLSLVDIETNIPELVLYDVASGDRLLEFEEPYATIETLTFHPGGDEVVSGNQIGDIVFWDVQTGEMISEIEAAHESSVSSVLWINRERQIISTSLDSFIRGWEVESGELIFQMVNQQAIYHAVLGRGGEELITGGCGGLRTAIGRCGKAEVTVWDLKQEQALSRMVGHQDELIQVGLGEGNTPLSISYDGSVLFWDIQPGAIIHRMGGQDGWITGADFSPDGQTALVGSGDFAGLPQNELILWDMQTGEIIRKFEGHNAAINDVEFHPDGITAVSASLDNSLILWDVETGEMIRQYEEHEEFVISVSFSPDGQQFASGSDDSTALIWDVATGEILFTLMGHEDTVSGVAYTPDGTKLISASADDTLIVWDVATGEPLGSLVGHEDDVTSVAVSPDGQTALSSSRDNDLILWDLATGELIRRFSEHSSDVLSVDFAPDGLTAISGGDDRVVIQWDVETGLALRQYKGHNGFILTVQYSPDGSTILSGGSQHTEPGERGGNEIFLWQVHSLPDLIQWVRDNRVVRELTCTELRQYDLSLPDSCS